MASRIKLLFNFLNTQSLFQKRSEEHTSELQSDVCSSDLFVVSIVLEVWYCKSTPNAAIKLAACLVLDAFAFLLPGVVATITAMHVIRKDKNKFKK